MRFPDRFQAFDKHGPDARCAAKMPGRKRNASRKLKLNVIDVPASTGSSIMEALRFD